MVTEACLVLASTSRWRLRMLEDAGLRCEAVAPVVDESTVHGADPVATAHLRARAKAVDVAARRPGRLVVGADQVLWLPGEAEAIGKPPDDERWRARLRQLRGREHQLTTAVALAGPEPGRVESFEETTGVRMRGDPSDAELAAYVAHGEARGCAGGYMVEGRGAWLVEALRGDWSNVVGLPVLSLIGHLRARGWRLGSDGLARPPGVELRDSGPA